MNVSSQVAKLDTATLISFYKELSKTSDVYADLLIDETYEELSSRLTDGEMLHLELEIESETLQVA